MQTEIVASPAEVVESVTPPLSGPGDPFAPYSTLPGKMARIEEILNGIGRFVGDPAFQDSLLADVHELQQRLLECRSLYPDGLSSQDQLKFDQRLEETAAVAEQLAGSLRSNDVESAREVITRLDQQRRDAHTRFSY